MPSLVAKIAPADKKGTAMGLFSSAQFLGAFSGGVLGGVMLSYESYRMAFVQLSLIVVFWWGFALFMKKPKAVTSKIVSLTGMDDASIASFREKVQQLPGVQELTVYLDDKVAYMKIDKKRFDDAALESLLVR